MPAPRAKGRKPSLISRLHRDRRGVAAVEFALIAPVMIALYFGLAEYCQAMMADRKATHVASSIGDLVAQSPQITPADLTDIFAVGKILMAPFPASDLKMRVTSVTVDATGKVAKVDWSQHSGWSGLSKGATVSVPANTGDSQKLFINANETAIMSEVEYSYDSPVDYFIKNKVVFTETFFLRPRKSGSVACPTC